MITTDSKTLRPASKTGQPTSQFRKQVNLITELAITQFKLKYTGSVLGYIWSLLKPLMLFSVMYLVFERFFKTGKASPEFTVQLLLAIVIWTFFSDTVSISISSIASAGNLIKKAYFPRWILVIASTISSLLTFTINLSLILFIATPLGHMHLGWRSLLAPLFVIELYLLIVGLAMFLASLFVFYRDMGHLWEISSQILFYGSAVVYPFAIIPGKILPKLVAMNPAAQIIEDLRHALVTPGVPWCASILGALYFIPILLSIAIFILGNLTFRHYSPRFAEYL